MEKKKLTRSMPHNIEAEQSVLGCCLIDDNAVLTIMEEMKEEDFYTLSHRTIFDSMRSIYASGRPIDLVTLSDELTQKDSLDKVGGIEYITTLTNIVPSSANVKHYISIVKRDSLLRSLISSSEEIIQKSYEGGDEDILAFAEKSIFDIAERDDKSSLQKVSGSLDEVLSKFEEIHKNGGAIRGLATGFWELDNLTNGLKPGNLVILAARPGFGKSSLAMNIVGNVAIQYNKKCAVFSLEMSREEIAQRLVCSISGVNMRHAMTGHLSADDWKALWEGRKELDKADIYIDESSLVSPAEILSKCRKIKREMGGLDLIMIDYLQLMNGSSKYRDSNRQQEISDITRNLKVTAKELGVPILLLSQLSRDVEKREDHRPQVSDLRESGAIEQDADIVMFIYNEAKYTDIDVKDGPNICELIVAKHRNGPQGTIKIKWIPEITTFVNLEYDADRISLESTAPKDMAKYKEIIDNHSEE